VLAGHLSSDRHRRAPVQAPAPAPAPAAAPAHFPDRALPIVSWRGAAGSSSSSAAGSRARLAFVVCCVLLLPAWVADFRDANGRADGPTWQSQLSVAAATCRTETRASVVDVAIDPPRWMVFLPCRDVPGHAVRQWLTASPGLNPRLFEFACHSGLAVGIGVYGVARRPRRARWAPPSGCSRLCTHCGPRSVCTGWRQKWRCLLERSPEAWN
jgi:hypothetical protein